MFLCTITKQNLGELFGTISVNDTFIPGTNKREDFSFILIGQTLDNLSSLVLVSKAHDYFERQLTIPEGYSFAFKPEWGAVITEEIIKRVISTVRAEAYPPMADYLDAKVKGDTAQEQAYLDACVAVKAKYPKFSW